MSVLLGAWLSLAQLAHGQDVTLPTAPPPEALVERARASASLRLDERIAAISEALLGLPYVTDPAGEGWGHDPDPPGRFDAFDCLTFVEEVLSLSLALAPEDAAPIRRSLRYGTAAPSHRARRHFMEREWLPGVLKDGWLRDTTGSYGTPVVQTKQLTPEAWAGWSDRAAFPYGDERLPMGTMELAYLPLEDARAIVDSIRPGSVLLIVRADQARNPFWITHLGFVLRKDGRTVFRHASQMRSARRVTDSGLAWYLQHLTTYVRWPVAGVVILEPVDVAPRALPLDAP